MATLPSTTISRLLKLPQSDAVWEGDRRSLESLGWEDSSADHQDYILWVDGTEGTVRAMETVSSETGMEAMVRTLIRAIETPQSYGQPSRPKRVVVRDREIQFFLRGILQELEITIEHVAKLPLIDTLLENLQQSRNQRPRLLPESYETPLFQTAQQIWKNPPWEQLADSDIITIDLVEENVDPLYVSVMGMLGSEYGILLYRSLDSLKNFRSQIVQRESMEEMENVFLQQDCWFLNYDLGDENEDKEDIEKSTSTEVQPYFGSINPYEGIRPFLGEEEAKVVYVALQALQQFMSEQENQQALEQYELIEKQYAISLPETVETASDVTVKVSTNPELEEEFMEGLEEQEEDSESAELSSPIREDLVPEDSFLSIGMMPWEVLEQIQNNKKKYYQSMGISPKGEGMPIILIQTTRPKAKEMIEQIEELGGLRGIGFNTGEDPEANAVYDLGLLQMGNGELYLFGEFQQNETTHANARQKWDRRCQQTDQYCGLMIASGLKGASRGQPQMKDMMAFFEAQALSTEDLGLGVLQLMEW